MPRPLLIDRPWSPADMRVGEAIHFRQGMELIAVHATFAEAAAFLEDIRMGRRGEGGWPTRDRAAPEEEC